MLTIELLIATSIGHRPQTSVAAAQGGPARRLTRCHLYPNLRKRKRGRHQQGCASRSVKRCDAGGRRCPPEPTSVVAGEARHEPHEGTASVIGEGIIDRYRAISSP